MKTTENTIAYTTNRPKKNNEYENDFLELISNYLFIVKHNTSLSKIDFIEELTNTFNMNEPKNAYFKQCAELTDFLSVNYFNGKFAVHYLRQSA